MNRNPNYGLFAVAAAVAVVGALWLGVPLGTLAILGVVLVCPLTMIFMMRGMQGGGMHDHHTHGMGNDHSHDSGTTHPGKQ